MPADDELLADYREASEDARYRDRLLYNSYYLAIILLVFLAQLVVTVAVNGHRLFVAGTLFGGGVLYLLLTAWAVGVRKSRNNAWARREKIEEKIGQLQTNQYAGLKIGPEEQEIPAEIESELGDDPAGWSVALAYAKKRRQISDIPEIVQFLDPDLVTWFLIPVSIILVGLSILVFITELARLWLGWVLMM